MMLGDVGDGVFEGVDHEVRFPIGGIGQPMGVVPAKGHLEIFRALAIAREGVADHEGASGVCFDEFEGGLEDFWVRLGDAAFV